MTFNLQGSSLCPFASWRRQPNQKPELGSPHQALNRYSRAVVFRFLASHAHMAKEGPEREYFWELLALGLVFELCSLKVETAHRLVNCSRDDGFHTNDNINGKPLT